MDRVKIARRLTIENAIKDLDSATARTLNVDQRLNELMGKSGVYR
jgi:hypothetical protein